MQHEAAVVEEQRYLYVQSGVVDILEMCRGSDVGSSRKCVRDVSMLV